MDYEKKYKEALSRAKELMSRCVNNRDYKIIIYRAEDIQSIFPELKENEDERISKDIIHFLDRNTFQFGEDIHKYKSWVAWLEKQGKKPQGKSALEAINEEKVDNQNCVKHTDEPKFHEGEWLTENHPNNYARFVQILEIVNVQGKKKYRISRDLHNDEDIVECRFVEDYWHHFNMQDAKDGDVLVCDNGNNKTIYLFKEQRGLSNIANAYFQILNMNNELRLMFNKAADFNLNTKPATKEQCDLLFQKMTEAGYEWDEAKKELNKIEESENFKNQIMSEITDSVKDYIISKPAKWSEEDEKKFSDTLAILRGGENCYYNSPILFDWLKSLKERIGK